MGIDLIVLNVAADDAGIGVNVRVIVTWDPFDRVCGKTLRAEQLPSAFRRQDPVA
jgi:hypothetical protein